MSTVYVVTSGSYSDYRIEAIFSTREKAEEHKNLLDQKSRWDDNEIVEWAVDDPEKQDLVLAMEYYSLINLKDGRIAPSYHSYKVPRLVKRGTQAGRINVDPSRGFATAESYVSKEHADKLAVEARQEWLREQSVLNSAFPRTTPAVDINQPYEEV